jgi:hypothetical protein
MSPINLKTVSFETPWDFPDTRTRHTVPPQVPQVVYYHLANFPKLHPTPFAQVLVLSIMMLRSLRLVKNRVPFGVARRRASTGAQGTGAQGTGAQGTGAQGTGAQGTGAQGTGAQGTGAQGTLLGKLPSVEKIIATIAGALGLGGIGYDAFSVKDLKDDSKTIKDDLKALGSRLDAQASRTDALFAALLEERKLASKKADEESKRYFGLLEEVKDIKRKPWWQ